MIKETMIHKSMISDDTKMGLMGRCVTERWTDAEAFDIKTHINLPHEEAVEDAKKWCEDNEL